MNHYKAVLFDLDGTLMDTSIGIKKGIDVMLKGMNLPALTDEEKVKFIGPALSDSYSKYLGLEGEEMEKAIGIYRKYCVEHAYKEVEQYPGMEELLKELKERGILTAVVTNKKQPIADLTVKESGLDQYLTMILGNNDIESISKAGLIQMVLDKYNLNRDEVLLVGDTDIDAKGAYEAGIDFYPALYGFGYLNSGYEANYPNKHCLNKPLDLLDYI